MKKMIYLALLLLFTTTQTVVAMPEYTMHDELFEKYCTEYEVDIYFAKAVAMHESGVFTSYAYRNKNNCFGIMGKKGTRRFNSVEESVEYFCKLMNKKCYKGKSISEIGKIYCPSGTSHWVKCINYYTEYLKGEENETNNSVK